MIRNILVAIAIAASSTPTWAHGELGGGLGMLHGAIAGVESLGSPRSQDDACKTCFTAIIADEAGHLGGAIAGFLEAECDAEQEAAVLDALTICLTLKVAERREQFAAQLGRSRPCWPAIS